VGSAFSSAILEAYNTHSDLILGPDDLWLVVQLKFSEWVNAHAEEVRNLFVSHEGKKKLLMLEPADVEEREWGKNFFAAMHKLITEHLNRAEGHDKKASEVLLLGFSTTTDVHKMLSFAAIMDSFEAYFECGLRVCSCGFMNVTLLGTEQDWMRLTEKLEALRRMMATTGFALYLTRLRPIFANFLMSYRGAQTMQTRSGISGTMWRTIGGA
jgi:hypothetical protein